MARKTLVKKAPWCTCRVSDLQDLINSATDIFESKCLTTQTQ